MHVRRAGGRRAGHDRHAVDLDRAGLPAQVPALPRPDRRRLRALRRRLRRTARPAACRSPPHRIRPRQAGHRHGDGVGDSIRSAPTTTATRSSPTHSHPASPPLRRRHRHEQGCHRRHRDARVRAHRRRVGHGSGRHRRASCTGRLRQTVVRHAVRRRRLDGRRRRRHHGQPHRAHRLAVHERRQRLRHRRHCAGAGRQHHRIGGGRRRHRHRLRQARARRVPHQGASRQGLVRRLRPRAHHPVLRDEDHPIHARLRHQPAEPRPRRRRRRSATGRSTRWRGGASR